MNSKRGGKEEKLAMKKVRIVKRVKFREEGTGSK